MSLFCISTKPSSAMVRAVSLAEAKDSCCSGVSGVNWAMNQYRFGDDKGIDQNRGDQQDCRGACDQTDSFPPAHLLSRLPWFLFPPLLICARAQLE